jgi:non-specific serine/threonine protein kinase
MPNNLPRQLTSFIGREKEIAEVKRLLSTACLVTLTGTGGAGKSRLALQIGADLLDKYPDGVWFVELAPLSDPTLVAKAVASALDVPEQPGRPLDETLVDALRSKALLLLLDNCEHLLAACRDLTASLLRKCSQVRILVTSREGLGVPGETLWRVPSLSVPKDIRHLPPPEELILSDAVHLFVDRAMATLPDFTITSENGPAVAQICQRLDGIPLAIELAAVRVKVLAVEQIAARLDDRFRLLTGGSPTLLARHQTLRATLDWSFGLLSDPERTVLRRLSVFAGGWTLEAAEAVCAGDGIEVSDILDLLTQLVDKSLVVAETQRGEARYRLLETLRQYGRDRLQESGEAVKVRRHHRDWYLKLAEQAEPKLRGPEQMPWLERLESEHDNLRAALDWSATEEDAEGAMRLAGALEWFWYIRGHWSEERKRMEETVSRANEAPGFALAKVLIGATRLYRMQGEHARAAAISLAERGLVLCRDLGARESTAELKIHLGIISLYQGDYGKAGALIEEGITLCREYGYKWLASAGLANIGCVARARGDYAAAKTFTEESLVLAKDVGDRFRIAYSLRYLGILALREADYDRAAAFYRESLVLCGEMGLRWIASDCLAGLSEIACHKGRFERAARLFAAEHLLRETLGLRRLPFDQAAYDHCFTATRAALESSAFAAAWAEGRAMTLDLAIEYAREPIEAVPLKTAGMEELTAGKQADLLTPREREVAALIARGLTNRQIASRLVITERTADTHVQHILNKLNVNSRAQIAAWAVEHGLQTGSKD